MKKISIIFDLDGTLWDATESTFKSANLISEKYNQGKIELQTIKNGMGQTKEYNAKLYFPNVDIEKAICLLDEVSIKNIELLNKGAAIIYPDVDKVLSDLSKKMDLYIVSNSAHQDYVNACTKYLSCNFKEAIAAGSLGMNKSECIKYIIEKNKMEKAIYVGDTELDQLSAQEANIPFIYVKYGFGNIKNSKYEINNINELENKIMEIDSKF